MSEKEAINHQERRQVRKVSNLLAQALNRRLPARVSEWLAATATAPGIPIFRSKRTLKAGFYERGSGVTSPGPSLCPHAS